MPRILLIEDEDSIRHLISYDLKNAGFDDLTLADWEADTLGKVEAPFTFTNYEYLDTITEN